MSTPGLPAKAVCTISCSSSMASCLCFLYLTGAVSGPTDFALYYLEDPTAFYLSRPALTVAIMGTLTCLVIYWLGKRIYGIQAGTGRGTDCPQRRTITDYGLTT